MRRAATRAEVTSGTRATLVPNGPAGGVAVDPFYRLSNVASPTTAGKGILGIADALRHGVRALGGPPWRGIAVAADKRSETFRNGWRDVCGTGHLSDRETAV
jgi:hypothetical protein